MTLEILNLLDKKHRIKQCCINHLFSKTKDDFSPHSSCPLLLTGRLHLAVKFILSVQSSAFVEALQQEWILTLITSGSTWENGPLGEFQNKHYHQCIVCQTCTLGNWSTMRSFRTGGSTLMLMFLQENHKVMNHSLAFYNMAHTPFKKEWVMAARNEALERETCMNKIRIFV